MARLTYNQQNAIDNQCDCCGGESEFDLTGHLENEGAPSWLAEAVFEAVANGDMKFLNRQVERHVPGWVTP